jgi:proprotein convertase subtilisin/kexin type 2
MRAPLISSTSSLRLAPALVLAAALVGLVGCGGGGSTAPAPAPAPAPSPAPGPAPAPAPAPGPAPAPVNGKVTVGPGCFEYSIVAPAVLSGIDPLLAQQWHLTNTGQNGGVVGEDLRVSAAWATTKGAGARIAVIDDAIEVTHPDLRPNLVEGGSYSYRPSNFGSVWPLPCSIASDSNGPIEGHGTAVAGLAAARDGNAVAGAGVAPRASLVAYDALSSGTDVDIADALNRDATAVGVYHNSWGSPDDGSLHAPDALFTAALRRGIDTGRGGKGSVYVFSAGNGGCIPRAGGPCLVDNANYDGFVNGLGVITVCAVDKAGTVATYSEPGANLTVCAPSSGTGTPNVITTSLLGGTRTDFSGTSASAPMVSGVVALMLAANPNLTWRDVRLLLASTARRTNLLDASWEPSALPTKRSDNQARAFSHKYGYGVVDAAEAVRAASTWTSVGGSGSQIACTLSSTVNAALPDATVAGTGTVVGSNLTFTGCGIGKVEFVEVSLTSDHTYAGDLKVRLLAPGGAASVLADQRACGPSRCGSYAAGHVFGSVRHLDGAANGVWRLEVSDLAPVDAGTFNSWSITIHGRSN